MGARPRSFRRHRGARWDRAGEAGAAGSDEATSSRGSSGSDGQAGQRGQNGRQGGNYRELRGPHAGLTGGRRGRSGALLWPWSSVVDQNAMDVQADSPEIPASPKFPLVGLV